MYFLIWEMFWWVGCGSFLFYFGCIFLNFLVFLLYFFLVENLVFVYNDYCEFCILNFWLGVFFVCYGVLKLLEWIVGLFLVGFKSYFK